MDDAWLGALKGSIQKWQDILDGTGFDQGGLNCPLCIKAEKEENERAASDSDDYDEQICLGCPVLPHTKGKGLCARTPYADWLKHQWTHHPGRGDGVLVKRVYGGCAECHRMAKAEVDFLKSLLPKEDKCAECG